MDDKNFILPKKNLMLIAVGLAIIILGFLLMTGSKTETNFNPDIYSARRIVVAPMVTLAGFVFVIFAILFKRKSTNE